MEGVLILQHQCQRHGDGSAFFRADCPACQQEPKRASIARALTFLNDALEESSMTEDEMHAEPGTFYVRLLCAKASLEEALA